MGPASADDQCVLDHQRPHGRIRPRASQTAPSKRKRKRHETRVILCRTHLRLMGIIGDRIEHGPTAKWSRADPRPVRCAEEAAPASQRAWSADLHRTYVAAPRRWQTVSRSPSAQRCLCCLFSRCYRSVQTFLTNLGPWYPVMPAAKSSLRRLCRFVCNGRRARSYYNSHGADGPRQTRRGRGGMKLCLCGSERFATHCGFFTLEDNAFRWLISDG